MLRRWGVIVCQNFSFMNHDTRTPREQLLTSYNSNFYRMAAEGLDLQSPVCG